MTDRANEGGRDLDLERELSCSICTDVLYRPLTLLDCLHTFCGSCLKEWFAWQTSSRGHLYSCPACRAAVRDTRPNATLTTLLEMFLQAHPDKGKTAQEKLDMDKTYKPGDDVIPPVDLGQVSEEADQDEQQMLAQARELSLDEVGLGYRSTNRVRHTHTRHARHHADSLQSNQADSLSHQSSIRSLLSQSDVDLGDMEDEIMRHIIDHGLLDGMDLNNLTPDQEDAITDSIAQAYRSRRRQDRRDRDRTRDRDRSSAHYSPTTSAHRQSPRSSTHQLSNSTSAHHRTTSTTTNLVPHVLPSAQTHPYPTRRRAASANHTHRLNTTSGRHQHLAPDSPSRPSNHSSPLLPIPPREGLSSDISAPSIACSRCEKPNIQHSLHYNCEKCSDGNFNLCLACYRAGKGCLNWYGFGHITLLRYRPQDTLRSEHADQDPPHVLSARRYVQDTARLEQGLFCDGCQACANACYWHCDVCNDGAWGFCNACVQQGKHCTHPLASIAHASLAPTASSRNLPSDLYPPPLTAANSAFHFAMPSTITPILPHVPDLSSYAPITLTSYCDICHYSIPPSHARFHCNICNKGNYDICTSCYHSLVNTGKIAWENGPSGWRRCLRSHRMSVVGHEDREGGSHRLVVREMVGGWALKDDLTPSSAPSTQQNQWRWKENDGTHMATSPATSTLPKSPHLLPPDGGIGLRAQALWAYFPGDHVKDELRFPRNAIIKEVEDINGDWFWGVYCGEKGLFPGNYVRVV